MIQASRIQRRTCSQSNVIEEGTTVATSEDLLLEEIEELRWRLNVEVGERYEKAKIQAAGAMSSRLDDLICKWLEMQSRKRETS